jgi:hypothetical protein
MSKRQPAPPTRIQRSGNGHSYYLDGEKVPGVTTILSDGIPKTGLIGWASNIPADFVANLLQVTRNGEGRVRIVADELVEELRIWQQSRTGQKIVPWSDATPLPRAAVADALASLRFRDRDEAAGKGTEVHGLGDRLAHGEEVEVPEHLAGHVAAYVRFLDQWEPANAIVEGVTINRRWRYMGKFDLLAEFPGKVWSSGPWQGRPVGRGLLDIKTARSGIFSDVALQLQAYRFGETILRGLEEVPMPSVDFVAAIHVRADGYDVIPFDVTGDPNTDPAYRCFLYAKQVGEWLDWKEGPASRVRLDAATPPRNEGETP